MSVNIKAEEFDDSLLDNEPLFFDIDEAFFDDFFNIEESPPTPDDSIESSVISFKEETGIEDTFRKRKTSGAAGGGSMSTATTPAKKTRKEFVPEELSRIPKSDIRRTYPKLFTEVFNGQEKQETIKLLERIALSDLVCTHRFVGGSNPTGPAAFDVQGINAIATFWDTYQQAVPDSVFEILETKIRVSSTDRRSAILCKWISKGTKVLKLHGLEEGSEEKLVLSSLPGKKAGDGPTDLYGNTVLQVESSKGKTTSASPAGSAPVAASYSDVSVGSSGSSGAGKKFGLGDMLHEKIYRVGTMTIQLNSAKKIYRLEFVYSNKKSMINI